MSNDLDIKNRPAQEVIQTPGDMDEVSCDGGHPSLGHPKVWYKYDGKAYVDCGYCGRRFIKGS